MTTPGLEKALPSRRKELPSGTLHLHIPRDWLPVWNDHAYFRELVSPGVTKWGTVQCELLRGCWWGKKSLGFYWGFISWGSALQCEKELLSHLWKGFAHTFRNYRQTVYNLICGKGVTNLDISLYLFIVVFLLTKEHQHILIWCVWFAFERDIYQYYKDTKMNLSHKTPPHKKIIKTITITIIKNP